MKRSKLIPVLLVLLAICIQQTQQKHWWLTGNSQQLTVEDFDKNVGQGTHYAVKFFTPWCMYCQQMIGEWNKLTDHYIKESETSTEKIKTAKINCDEQRPICQKYNVYSFPTLLFFGKDDIATPHSQFQDRRQYDNLKKWIDESVVTFNKKQASKPKQNTPKQEEQKKEAEKQENDVVQDEQIIVSREEEQELLHQEERRIQEEEERLSKKRDEENKRQKEQKIKEQQAQRNQQQNQQQQQQQQQQENNQSQAEIDKYKDIIHQKDIELFQLRESLSEVRQQSQQSKIEKNQLESKLGQLYNEVRQIKDQLHNFRKQEVSQSKETLTTLNDFLFQETEQQQDLYSTHQKMMELEKQLIGENSDPHPEEKQENPEKEEQQKNKNKKKSQGSYRDTENMHKITEHNQLFVFGMTGAFIGFVIAFVSIKKPKQPYNHHALPVTTTIPSDSH